MWLAFCCLDRLITLCACLDEPLFRKPLVNGSHPADRRGGLHTVVLSSASNDSASSVDTAGRSTDDGVYDWQTHRPLLALPTTLSSEMLSSSERKRGNKQGAVPHPMGNSELMFVVLVLFPVIGYMFGLVHFWISYSLGLYVLLFTFGVDCILRLGALLPNVGIDDFLLAYSRIVLFFVCGTTILGFVGVPFRGTSTYYRRFLAYGPLRPPRLQDMRDSTLSISLPVDPVDSPHVSLRPSSTGASAFGLAADVYWLMLFR